MYHRERRVTSPEIQDLLALIQRYWKWVTICGILGAIVSVIFNYVLLPDRYEARAVIMAKTTPNRSSIDSFLGSAGSAMSLGGSFLTGPNAEIQQFQQILKSKALAREIVKIENLAPKLAQRTGSLENKKFEARAVRTLLKTISLKADMYSLTISFTLDDPELAYAVVAGLLEQLQKFLNQNVVTQSKNAEIFVKERLRELNNSLDESEQKLYRLKTGDRRAVTGERSIQAEIERVQREFSLYQQLVGLLSQQYELAQIESKRADPMFLVVDPPTIPVSPVGPYRLRNVLIGLICGVIIAVLLAAVRKKIEQFF